MAEVIKMPRLSDTMEDGKIEVWHKKVGDKVAYGDILAEIETDKAVQEFESDVDGVLLYIGVEEGQAVPVESLMAIIGEEGEDISALIEGEGSSDKEEKVEEPKEEVAANHEEEKADDASANEESSSEIPEDVHVVTMPRLSDTMETGKVVSWFKKVGDKVSFGDILAEIETDKAVQEFEIDVDGTLLKIGIEEGDEAPVDSLLAIIGPEGTDVSNISVGGNKPAEKKEAKKEESNKEEVKETKQESSTSSEKTNDSGRLFISPLAKKLAEDKGYDISQIKGTGDQGRIIKRDVENFQPQAVAKAAKTDSAAPVAAMAIPAGEDKRVENSTMRKVIAKRLSQSKYTAPHYYLNIEVDMENVMAARKQINAIPDTKISFNDIIVKAVAMALRKHPQVNSTWNDDAMILHGDISIGVAVAVPDGLMVPVVKNTDHKSLTQISAEIKDMATRARDKKIKADEMEGSTFTVSNLGAYGIESFTSIINQPNSCILSVGAIVEKPVVKNGQIVVGNTMKLSLACDHRTVDGATGSLFLQTLQQYLETPMAMFL
ncbi:pyruvate dehydrogenase complex dihydrolipoamide acetyltransferase [Weeksellaceae bacterium KMM 9724]|uniref:pyruvate dehydrogenase complex dihydrolipoamide acetyltransferase n=1 Tax=Profundicola chukchiensis TaxID=2961959 RepID=UPI002439590C|nr:pyruvate dehydrogenase complex dihydrolipoamide acetyltransferase [Profundicola chukchiensis]MDG4951111.1 pyruvate dehydrogenase complex dihydrolipoamide acetyltransferase [Profundicola chukchiensis]